MLKIVFRISQDHRRARFDTYACCKSASPRTYDKDRSLTLPETQPACNIGWTDGDWEAQLENAMFSMLEAYAAKDGRLFKSPNVDIHKVRVPSATNALELHAKYEYPSASRCCMDGFTYAFSDAGKDVYARRKQDGYGLEFAIIRNEMDPLEFAEVQMREDYRFQISDSFTDHIRTLVSKGEILEGEICDTAEATLAFAGAEISLYAKLGESKSFALTAYGIRNGEEQVTCALDASWYFKRGCLLALDSGGWENRLEQEMFRMLAEYLERLRIHV